MEEYKELKVHGRNVTVMTEKPERGTHVIFRAECDGEICEHSMTIGPAEGAGPEDYDEARLQCDLDAARQKVAERAAWQARIRSLIDKVA